MKLTSTAIAVTIGLASASLLAQRGAGPKVADPVVMQFMIDGIDANSVRTAVASGATALGALLKEGVTLTRTTARARRRACSSPMALCRGAAARARTWPCTRALTCSSRRNIDDIFLSARRVGIVSVFAGGSQNYAIFKNATHLYYGGNELTDEIVVDRGLQHLTKDNARLLRLHLQHIRNAWKGPATPPIPNRITSNISSRPSIRSWRD